MCQNALVAVRGSAQEPTGGAHEAPSDLLLRGGRKWVQEAMPPMTIKQLEKHSSFAPFQAYHNTKKCSASVFVP